jgi:26S proteasome regulatory subunit N5
MGFEKEIEVNRDLALRAGQVQDAIDALLALERTARLSGDVPGTTEVCVAIVKICHDAKQWQLLNDQIQLLAKRRAQLKQVGGPRARRAWARAPPGRTPLAPAPPCEASALSRAQALALVLTLARLSRRPPAVRPRARAQAIQGIVQEATKWVDEQSDESLKLQLITTLRTVTEGKMYVEVERARLSLTLARMRESEGKLEEARNVLQDTQVETLGGMDKREKTDFVLQQVRLCLETSDYMRAWIMAKKINVKFFDDGSLDDLKIRYYGLVTRYHMHDKETFELFRSFQSLYNTAAIKEDSARATEVLKLTVIYLLLSPHGNEQQDQMFHVKGIKELEDLPLYAKLLELFTTHEVFTYDGDISAALDAEIAPGGPLGDALGQFGGLADHISQTMHLRIVQHNIRVLAKFYKRIHLSRLAALLKVKEADAERELSEMVTTGAIYARIDRPAGVVTFKKPQQPNELLNDWSGNISKLLNLVDATCHQIHKETMVHNVK